MARLAVVQSVVVEIHILEVARILMAACTCAGIMISRRVVTSRTILPANVGMAERRIAEIIRILVAALTRAGIMTLRRVVAGRTILPADIGVAE